MRCPLRPWESGSTAACVDPMDYLRDSRLVTADIWEQPFAPSVSLKDCTSYE